MDSVTSWLIEHPSWARSCSWCWRNGGEHSRPILHPMELTCKHFHDLQPRTLSIGPPTCPHREKCTHRKKSYQKTYQFIEQILCAKYPPIKCFTCNFSQWGRYHDHLILPKDTQDSHLGVWILRAMQRQEGEKSPEQKQTLREDTRTCMHIPTHLCMHIHTHTANSGHLYQHRLRHPLVLYQLLASLLLGDKKTNPSLLRNNFE